MRRLLFGMAVVVAALPTGPTAASAAPLPVVTVTSGPTKPTTIVEECSDVARQVDVSTAFVVHRDVAGATPLVLRYTLGGAQRGVDYAPLPGSVTIPAGAKSATVSVTPLLGTGTHEVDLDIRLTASSSYTRAVPRAVRITFVSKRDPARGNPDCDPAFQLGPDATNHEQTIRIGQRPRAFTATRPVGLVRLVGGSLPAGVTFTNAGSFEGAATTPGTSLAALDVCNGGIVITCRRTPFVVHVLPANAGNRLPRTGSPGPAPIAAGLLLVFVGALLAGATCRRSALLAPRR